MIHWLTVSIPLPYFIPTSGMVALWLIVGTAVLVWLAASTAFNKRRGFTPYVIKDGALMGLLATAVVVIVWPLVLYFRCREAMRLRAQP